MTIILRMQHLPWSATSMDIRRYFTGLSIPDGGVHIVGGENGDVFIAFSSDENARRAMQIQNRPLCGNKIVLMLSSKSEMQEVIARNRAQAQGKSDPFQAERQNQSPVPTNQPIVDTGGGALPQDRDFAGYKGPSKTQAGGQFDPKPQNKTLLPSGDPGKASNSPQRSVGEKSLLGLPPYGSQPPDPALGRQPGYFHDPNAGYDERRDEVYLAGRRQGEQMKRPLIDARRQPDIPADHGPRVDAPSGEDQLGGNSFRDRDEFPKQPLGQVPGDMDSRHPPGRRPPLLEHEPRGQEARSSYGLYGDLRGGESMPDEAHNKRFKGGKESMPPYDHRAPFPDEEKFGPGRQWDKPFEDTKQGFPGKGPDDVKRFGQDDRTIQRGPMHGDPGRYDPDTRWPQSGPRMGADGQRFSGDPFGLNDPYDDPRGSDFPRDREAGRGGFDSGRREPMDQMGPESYMKREEHFPSGRDQRYHEAGGSSDRMGRDRFDPGEQRGPGDHINDRRGPSDIRREKLTGVDNRGPGDGLAHENRMERGPGGHIGRDERGMAGHGVPDRRMGFGEGRGPGEPRGSDSRFGPEDPMRRPKDDFPSKDSRFEQGMRQGERRGPEDFMDPGSRMGLGDRGGPEDFMNQDQTARAGSRFGPSDRLSAGDHPGAGGTGERRGLGDQYGLEERMRVGSGDRFGPVDRLGEGNLLEPRDFVAGDRPGSGMGPGDRNVSEDRRLPGEPFRQGGRFGRDGPLGLDDQGPAGPQRLTPDRQQGRRLLPERHDPSDRSRPDDPIGPPDPFGRDQWRPKGNSARPSLLGQPGMSEQDRLGPRGPTDYLDLGAGHPGGPAGPAGRRDGQGERQGPGSRMAPDDLEPVGRLRKESRFGPSVHEKSMDRDSDMRRGDLNLPGPHQSGLGNRKQPEARKKPGFVRVTGLPYSVSKAEVADFFGDVDIAPNGIRFCIDDLRKKPNGNGFMKVLSEEDVAKACKYNMKYLGKRYIEVKRCDEADWENVDGKPAPPSDYPSKSSKHGRRSRSHSPIRSLCIEMRGIPLHGDVQLIKDFFYGIDLSTDKIFLMLSSDNIPTGTAYVEFPNQQMFEKAMRRNDRVLEGGLIELKPILKEVMNARVNDSKKQDRHNSSRSSSSTRESASSRGPGPRGSSRDSKYSSPRDRDSRESGSRSSRDQDLRQSSRSGRESQRGSDRESKSRDHNSRQNAAKPKDPPKDTSSRSTEPRSRYGRDETPQKRNGESKDLDSRRSGSAAKPPSKEAEPKQPESAPKDEKPKPQLPIQKDPPPKSNMSAATPPKPQVEVPAPVGKAEPPSVDDKSCINMRNMPFNTSDDEIHKFFEDMALQPLMVHFLITPEGRPNGQAYVEFANAADAHKAASRKDARIRDRNILMTIITKGHMQNCLAQGKPPPPSPALLGLPRGPPFPHQPGNRPPMDFRPPLLSGQGPPFGMRNPGPMRGPRPPPPIDVLIARGCVVETSNLPFDIPIPAIIDFFGNHNVIPETVRLKTNEHGRFSGEAMVAFRTAHDASRAIDDLSRSILGGRVIRLHLIK